MGKDTKIARIKRKVITINQQLQELDMNHDEVMAFWEECFIEAEINHLLPRCRCGDVNQCEVWCRAKARFSKNPPSIDRVVGQSEQLNASFQIGDKIVSKNGRIAEIIGFPKDGHARVKNDIGGGIWQPNINEIKLHKSV